MTDKETKMQGNPVAGLSFEQLSTQDVAKTNAIFNALGGFKTIELIKKFGYIGKEGKLVKIDYIVFQEDKLVFEGIKE